MTLIDHHSVWILIPIAFILAGLVRQSLSLKERRIDAGDGETAAHTARLEQRVRVLERIVTDKGLDVSVEIERLRDTHAY